MKTLYNFFKPTVSSFDHAVKAKNHVVEVSKDTLNVVTNSAGFVTNGGKLVFAGGAGALLFKAVAGGAMLSYALSSSVYSTLGNSTFAYVAEQVTKTIAGGIYYYPKASLATTVLASMGVHYETLGKFLLNTVSMPLYSGKALLDSVQAIYEVGQTIYTKAWETIDPSIIEEYKKEEVLEEINEEDEEDALEEIDDEGKEEVLEEINEEDEEVLKELVEEKIDLELHNPFVENIQTVTTSVVSKVTSAVSSAVSGVFSRVSNWFSGNKNVAKDDIEMDVIVDNSNINDEIDINDNNDVNDKVDINLVGVEEVYNDNTN